MDDVVKSAVPERKGRLMLLAGLALPFAGLAGYAVQLSRQSLMLPWYIPVAALAGVALVGASWWRRRTVGRGVVLGAVGLLAGLELLAMIAMRLPAYEGPLEVGKPFPVFEARTASGRAFRQGDLIGEMDQVLVFFRGRW